MIRFPIILLLTVLTLPGLASETRQPDPVGRTEETTDKEEEDLPAWVRTRYRASESDTQGEEADRQRVMRRLKPLERARAGFRIEQALHVGDSMWVVIRIALPHGAIRRKELLETSFLLLSDLNRPNAQFALTELNRISLFDERIEGDGLVRKPDADPEEATQQEFKLRKRRVVYLYYSCKIPYDPYFEEHPSIAVSSALIKGDLCFFYQDLALPFAWNNDPKEWKQAEALPQQALLDYNPVWSR